MEIDPKQFQLIIDAIREESDRAAAVLGAATVDALLSELLVRAMKPDSSKKLFESNGAFATFSAKIEAAYAFGLIGTLEYRDLHLVRKIRNDFAHAFNHELSFETEAIANRTRELSLLKCIPEDHSLRNGVNDTSRLRFEFNVGIIVTVLQWRMSTLRPATEPKAVSGPEKS
jgi:mannitol operon repressor